MGDRRSSREARCATVSHLAALSMRLTEARAARVASDRPRKNILSPRPASPKSRVLASTGQGKGNNSKSVLFPSRVPTPRWRRSDARAAFMAAGHPPVGLEGTSPPRAPEPGGTGADLRGVGPDDAFPSFGARRDHGARATSGGSSRRAPTTNSHKRSEEARRFAASAAGVAA